jgi:hypothetical protein
MSAKEGGAAAAEATAAKNDQSELKDVDVSYLNDRLDEIFKNTAIHFKRVYVDKLDQDETKVLLRFGCDYRNCYISRSTTKFTKEDLQTKADAVLIEIESMALDVFQEREWIDLSSIRVKSDVINKRMQEIRAVDAAPAATVKNDQSEFKDSDVSFVNERLDKMLKDSGITRPPAIAQRDDDETVSVVVRGDYRGTNFGKTMRVPKRALDKKNSVAQHLVDLLALSFLRTREYIDVTKGAELGSPYFAERLSEMDEEDARYTKECQQEQASKASLT